jgi:hypothetical protein
MSFETLESIFRMITPFDLLGTQKISLGDQTGDGIVSELLKVIYDVGPGGILTIENLAKQLNDLTTKVELNDPAKLEQFKRIFSYYNNANAKVSALGPEQDMALLNDGQTLVDGIKFRDIVGIEPTKKMGVLLCNTGYISPATRNGSHVEVFMNSLPSIVASRMAPFLEVEFSFSKPDNVPFQAPSLMKFLLGADKSNYDFNGATPDNVMLTARGEAGLQQPIGGIKQITTAGMEMFTSPQTLINASPVSSVGRYVDILDPFRPFMSIESLNVNVTPTVGLFSYKKASLSLKLHDRSRLAEISDLVRPQAYQSENSAPTIWLTYGWRHPFEPSGGGSGSETYADFINSKMLVREAYGIANSQFKFETDGQVSITLELWMRGVPELRTKKITDDRDGSLKAFEDLKHLADDIKKYKEALGIGASEGTSREVRGFLLIDSAERQTFPDMSTDEIQTALKALKDSFKTPGAGLNTEAANKLVATLEKYYQNTDDNKQNLDFKTKIKNNATEAALRRLTEVTRGVDPFLPISQKLKPGDTQHPLTSLVDAVNAYMSEADVKDLKKSPAGIPVGTFNKRLVSFGKLATVFMGQAIDSIDSVDELQMVFYQLNDRAGTAASTNIAQFPIDMQIFLDQYRQLVERKGSERLTIEEFFQLVIDTQFNDSRAPGYGFRSYFKPYDPMNPEQQLEKGKEFGYENARAGFDKKSGPFMQPQIEMYVETAWAAESGGDSDLLHRFERQQTESSGVPNSGIAGTYVRVMRIHVFDKTNNPYKAQGRLVRGNEGGNPSYIEVPNDYKNALGPNADAVINALKEIEPTLQSDGTIARTAGNGVSNQSMKQLVSRTVPTIIYGANGSSVTSADLSSKQDPLLTVSQMQTVAKKSGKPSVGAPNGSGGNGLPLRIIPASLTLSSLGCPLLSYGQMFFIDFNTGTTADNIYLITGLNHNITPGKFESQLTLTFYDAYGQYEGAPTVAEYVKQQLLLAQEVDTQAKKK